MLETDKDASDVFGDGQREAEWRPGHSSSISLLRVLFRLIYFLTHRHFPPLPSVGVVLEHDGQILFIDRSDGLGFSLPGSVIKSDKTVEEALQREVSEETGYEILITGLVGIYSDPCRDPRFSSLGLVYSGVILAGEERSSREGLPVWMPKDTLPVSLAFDHRKALIDYFDGTIRLR